MHAIDVLLGDPDALKTDVPKLLRMFLLLLVLLNCVVLLGQLWPEGAPPFAGTVNIVFLCLSLLYFVAALLGRVGGKSAE